MFPYRKQEPARAFIYQFAHPSPLFFLFLFFFVDQNDM